MPCVDFPWVFLLFSFRLTTPRIWSWVISPARECGKSSFWREESYVKEASWHNLPPHGEQTKNLEAGPGLRVIQLLMGMKWVTGRQELWTFACNACSLWLHFSCFKTSLKISIGQSFPSGFGKAELWLVACEPNNTFLSLLLGGFFLRLFWSGPCLSES